MRAFVLAKMAGGVPQFNSGASPGVVTESPLHGYVLCAQQKGWGVYLVSGTQAQLDTIAKLDAKQAVQIVQVSQKGGERFPELKAAMSTAASVPVAAWLSEAKETALDSRKTTGENLEALVRKWNPHWTLEGTDVDEPTEDVKPVEEKPADEGLEIVK